MRVVVDTNVLISAAIRDRLPKFLACAKAAGAEFMITGDADFEAAAKGGTRIVSVSAFARLFGI